MNEFDQKAREWDKNRMHLDRTLAVAGQLQKMILLRPGMTAMEFGAGTGLLSFYLKDSFSEITLMDNSREMLKMAEQKMDKNDHSKFRTVFLNLENEEYTGDTFDIIYSQMVLHHIQDVNAIFGKFFHLLKPGGIVAIADLYREDGSFHDGAMELHHGFDPDELKEIVVRQGFHEYRIAPCFLMKKEVAAGNIKEYQVFLMTAKRPES